MTKDEALRLAVAALKKSKDSLAEELSDWAIDPPLPHVLEAHDACEPAIKACEAALAQPKPEPVAWMDGYRNIYSLEEIAAGCLEASIPLYTHPKEWQNLTDEEIDEAYDESLKSFRRHQMSIRGQQITASDDPNWHFALAILKAAKEKNT